MRHFATSRKVAGSIPDGTIAIFFIDLILPAAILTMESVQPLTVMGIFCVVDRASMYNLL